MGACRSTTTGSISATTRGSVLGYMMAKLCMLRANTPAPAAATRPESQAVIESWSGQFKNAVPGAQWETID